MKCEQILTRGICWGILIRNSDKRKGCGPMKTTIKNLDYEKVVALPVKDPYHIIRNLILIIELLYAQLEKN